VELPHEPGVNASQGLKPNVIERDLYAALEGPLFHGRAR
jgi:hypothetical protein